VDSPLRKIDSGRPEHEKETRRAWCRPAKRARHQVLLGCRHAVRRKSDEGAQGIQKSEGVRQQKLLLVWHRQENCSMLLGLDRTGTHFDGPPRCSSRGWCEHDSALIPTLTDPPQGGADDIQFVTVEVDANPAAALCPCEAVDA